MGATKTNARRTLHAALLAVMLAWGGVAVVQANYYSNNPWYDGDAGGDVSIWLGWNRDTAVARAEMWADGPGDVQVETWVDQGTAGVADDRYHGSVWAEKHDSSRAWCGTVTGMANFWYIENNQWYGYGQHVPAEVYTEGCI